MQLYPYFVSQSSEFCRHNSLCYLSTSNTKGKRIFRYRLSPETFGYILVYRVPSSSLPSNSQFHCHLQQSVKKNVCTFSYESRNSSVGIALGYGLDDRGFRVRFPAEAVNFSLHHRVQNGSGAHLAPYPMGTGGCFPGGKAPGAWSWRFTSI
jgi:hypothetical protein